MSHAWGYALAITIGLAGGVAVWFRAVYRDYRERCRGQPQALP